ncbi:MAG: AAA family ATPase [Candidatus Kariarchaeaceae archaeon]|jgi:hypothetical protein
MTVNSELDIPQITIANAKKLLKIIASKITSAGKQAIMLWGAPGIGKSDLVRQLAKDTDREFIDIRLSTIDPVDLRGLPHIDKELSLTKWLPPDFLPTEASQPGILFLDEINAASPMIQASAYQLILDRKLGNYEVPPNWLIIAAGNRLSDKSVTYRLPTALANRFSHFEIVVSAEEWYQWAWKNEIDPYIIAFLRHHPDLLIQFDPDSNRIAFPTPRSWAFASSFIEVRDVELGLYYKGLQSSVGSSASQQFLAFLKHRADLPDPEDILTDAGYDIPQSPDAQYVLMGALINALLRDSSTERVENYFKFVAHFSGTNAADYALILVKELTSAFQARDSGLASQLSEHPSFKIWLKENIDVLE